MWGCKSEIGWQRTSGETLVDKSLPPASTSATQPMQCTIEPHHCIRCLPYTLTCLKVCSFDMSNTTRYACVRRKMVEAATTLRPGTTKSVCMVGLEKRGDKNRKKKHPKMHRDSMTLQSSWNTEAWMKAVVVVPSLMLQTAQTMATSTSSHVHHMYTCKRTTPGSQQDYTAKPTPNGSKIILWVLRGSQASSHSP